MKNRTYFKHRIDMLDGDGEIIEHLAGVEISCSGRRSMRPGRGGDSPTSHGSPVLVAEVGGFAVSTSPAGTSRAS